MTTKICNTCKKKKDVSLFGINRKANSNNFHAGAIDQYKGDCKLCLAEKSKAYRAEHPDLWKKYKENQGKITKYPKENRLLLSAIRMRITDAKVRDKKKGRVALINVDSMYQLFVKQNGNCALTGVPLAIAKNTPLTLSIDKIKPELGYLNDNVQWVCWAVNRAKGDLTTIDFIDMCKRVTEKCRDYP